MSGICGVVQFTGAAAGRSILERMASRASCRGPDGISYHVAGQVGFACLSHDVTLDGSGACLPVVDNASPGSVFAADARLDNRDCFDLTSVTKRIRCEGLDTGLDANLITDAERMLGILLLEGNVGPGRMVGDFAFAFWDASRGELRLARDAMGMRSLYYRLEPDCVIFATEISQILAVTEAPCRLNEEAVAWYLADMQVPPGSVFYEGIHEVRPGEEVIIDRHGRLQQRIFWQPDPEQRIRYRDERDYAEHFRALLIEGARCRLQSRMPVGISLSGGMDSGSVASIGGWLQEKYDDIALIRAYSWAFQDFPDCDERQLSRLIVERYGIPTLDIPDSETYPLTELAATAPHVDDPYTSVYQGYVNRVMVSAQADGVGTILFGSRGDLMVGGAVFDVPGMLRAGLFRHTKRELGRLRRANGLSRAGTVASYALWPMISGLFPDRMRAVGQSALQGVSALAGRNVEVGGVGPVASVAEYVMEGFLRRVGLPRQEPVAVASEAYRNHACRDRYRHVFSPLAMRVASSFERLAATHKLAYADVWSDRRVAEFVLACPQHIVHRAFQPKRLPRLAMRGIMPNDVIWRARKVLPSALYLAALRGPAHDAVTDLMTNSRCAELGFIDETMLKRRFKDFVNGGRACDEIWPVLSLEIWLRQHWS